MSSWDIGLPLFVPLPWTTHCCKRNAVLLNSEQGPIGNSSQSSNNLATVHPDGGFSLDLHSAERAPMVVEPGWRG